MQADDLSNLQIVSYIFDSSDPPTPWAPLTLTRLAQYGGFDHFNFVQHITALPSDVVASSIIAGEAQVEPLPILDPIISSGTNSLFLYSGRADRFSQVAFEFETDSNVGYYNDFLENELHYANFVTDNTIIFGDHPRLPDYFLTPSKLGDLWHFSTNFVGVYADGSVDEESSWEGIGTNMNWLSNVVYDSTGNLSGQVYTANPFPDRVPPASGGQISGIEIDLTTVPEPSGWILGAVAVIVCLAFFLRRR